MPPLREQRARSGLPLEAASVILCSEVCDGQVEGPSRRKDERVTVDADFSALVAEAERSAEPYFVEVRDAIAERRLGALLADVPPIEQQVTEFHAKRNEAP